MAVILAVLAAAGWGAADFLGGVASQRRTSVLLVVGISELLGVVFLVPVLLARGSPPPANPRLLLAAVAGVAVTIELSLIYVALSRGEAFITAPVGALGAAGAVVIGLLGGDRLDLPIAAGLVLALLGGGVSAWTSGTSDGPTTAVQTAAICLGAAAAVATMLTCFHAAGRVDPYWATAIEHVSTGLSAGIAALVAGRRSLRRGVSSGSPLRALTGIAAIGVGGDLAYAAASHHGALSIVSAISSLYPVMTIVLGLVLQRQRPAAIQLFGTTLALVGAAVLGAAAG